VYKASIALCALFLLKTIAYARADEPAPQAFDIGPQPLAQALTTFARQSHEEILYAPDVVAAKRTAGVKGTMTPLIALKTLLKDTGLPFSSTPNGALLVGNPTPDTTQSAAPSYSPSEDSHTQEVGKKSSQDFRVAQVDQATAGPQALTQSSDQKPEEKLEEVVVTGTHIRGIETITSPIIQYDRAAIDRSGYLNTQDFIQSVPQAFGGGAYGATPDGTLGPGTNAGNNNEHATAVNLRGLGENATLVLLNGHRMAPSDYGNVVDISTVPLSAIDHIDVLTDGASAIYGADAVAGVVNIILRKNYDGAETRASYGGVTSGELRDQIYSQTLGTAWSTGSIMGTYEYNHQGTLPTSERSFTDTALPANIINPSTQQSVVLNADQHIGDALDIYGDTLTTWKYTSTVAATPGFSESNFSDPAAVNAHLGTSYTLPGGWVIDLGGTYARQKTNVGFNAYSLAPPPVVPLGRDIIFYRDTLKQYDLNLNGGAFALPGGDLKLAIGASRRSEDADETTSSSFFTGSSFGRTVTAEYAELYAPLLGARNNVFLVNQLVLTAALRHDQYSDFGGTTNPKFGLLWSPLGGLDLKANWGRAFRAPSPGELLSNSTFAPQVLGLPFTNPSGAGTVPIFLRAGANPALGPERATTFDVSVDFRPMDVPGLKFTLDYYRVNFLDRIIFPTFDPNALLHPNIYGSLLTYLPSDAAAAAYLASLEAMGYQFVDLNGTGSTGVRYAYDERYLNAAVVVQNGFDVTGDYAFEVGTERFLTGVNVAFINKVETQFSPTATATNLVNTYSNPLKLRLRWQGTWTHGPMDFTTTVNYSNAYTNPFSIPSAPISSFTTVDVTGAIQLAKGNSASLWHGTNIRVNAINLFNRAPPYATSTLVPGINYDVGQASPLGRFVSLQLIKQW
jgi:outer membrane receptor protein involved in Fe transport